MPLAKIILITMVFLVSKLLSEEALNKAASIMHQVDSCGELNVWNDEQHGDPLLLEKAAYAPSVTRAGKCEKERQCN